MEDHFRAVLDSLIYMDQLILIIKGKSLRTADLLATPQTHFVSSTVSTVSSAGVAVVGFVGGSGGLSRYYLMAFLPLVKIYSFRQGILLRREVFMGKGHEDVTRIKRTDDER